MDKFLKLSLCLLLFAAMGQAALAADDEPIEVGKLKIFGNFYGQVSADSLTSGATNGLNGFDISVLNVSGVYNFDNTWGATIQLGAGHLGITSIYSTALATNFINPNLVFLKQAKIVGRDLWGSGSAFTIGLMENQHFEWYDRRLGLNWISFSMDFLNSTAAALPANGPVAIVDTGVQAEGMAGPGGHVRH